jgi:hypothetical protein
MLPSVLERMLIAIEDGPSPRREQAVQELARLLREIQHSGIPLAHPYFDKISGGISPPFVVGDLPTHPYRAVAPLAGRRFLQPYGPSDPAAIGAQNLQPYDPPNSSNPGGGIVPFDPPTPGAPATGPGLCPKCGRPL